MASKFLDSFKKFPQALLKKSSDKFKDAPMAYYNSYCGMLEDVTCNSFDNNLYLFAVGTKKGEIKIYGSPGIVYTLVNSSLKCITLLKFLNGQGRLLAVNNDNEVLLWEYKIETSTWEMVSSISVSSLIINGKITTIDVSQTLAWKTESDDLLELLVVGSSTNKILQILVIGSRLHLFDGDDLSIDSEHVLSIVQNLSKDYDFGGIDKINFHPKNNSMFSVSYSNGLLLILESNVKSKEDLNDNKEIHEVVESKVSDEKLKENDVPEAKDKVEINDENKSPENQEIIDENVQIDNNKAIENVDENNDTIKSDAEKDKIVNKNQKIDDTKVEEIKPEIKKVKESIQVPYAHVQIPSIVKYFISNTKINVSWANDKISIIYEDSNSINLHDFADDSLQISDPGRTIKLPENIHSSISNFTYFDLKNINFGIYITNSSEKQYLVILKNDELHAEIETPSKIIDYVIAKNQLSNESESHILLILCESQLIAIDIESEDLMELDCPYLSLRNNSKITSLSSIIQAPALLFPNALNVNEAFKDWPLKSEFFSSDKNDDDTSIDIVGTGHVDGSINIWQVMPSGLLSLLLKVDSSEIFHQIAGSSDSISKSTHIQKKVGCYIADSEDNLLQITNINLMLHCSNNFSESSSNELFCITGNYSGTVLIFKYDGSDSKENLVEFLSDFDREGINWIDSEAPELLDKTDISSKLPKLNYIVRLNPSLPITALAFQPTWELLAVGCACGVVLVDFRQNKCVFSHLTLQKASKNNVIIQPPLSVGQQLKKSIRQSFRKLKKLKPATKHSYTVNEEKAKDKEENKPVEKEENKPVEKEEDKDASKSEDKEKEHQTEDAEVTEDKEKEEIKDHVEEVDNTAVTGENAAETTETELTTIDLSRKDKSFATVGSLLLVYTSLSSSSKLPCLFAGTNGGAIFAFEIMFEDNTNDSVKVKLTKELHLQHKAPILLLSIINSTHLPLLNSADQIGSYQRKFKNSDFVKNEDEKIEINTESKVGEVEIGPSGDSDKDDAKQKCGTLPSPVVQEEGVEPSDGARRSIDSSKDKINLSNANMKKSGTLPASFLQAIGKSQGSSDSHELLVVSEEQVKLFSLPSLKAKYKYKVVDTGHHFSHSKATGSQECESQDKKNENANVENQAEVLVSKPSYRRISSVGLCKVRGLKSSSDKWSVSIALTNGEIIVLHISNLKKYLSNVFNYSTSPILAGISNGELNLIISHAFKYNIQITDFSQNHFHRYESNVSIQIPKSARPIIVTKSDQETKVNEAVEEAKVETIEAEPIVNGHDHDIANGHEEDEEKDQMGDEAVVQNTSTVHHGDITMDSIKEYITNSDGNVTIKTFESTKEKQINVDDGQIVTTIHEKQIKDGEIIKDDVVKITSDIRSSNELLLKE